MLTTNITDKASDIGIAGDNYEEGEKKQTPEQKSADFLSFYLKTTQPTINRLEAEKRKITLITDSSFLLSVLSLLIGAVVIVCSLYKVYFTDNYDLSVSLILAIAGILVEFFGICMVYVHLKNLDLLKINQEMLKKHQETMISIQLLQDVILPTIDDKQRGEIMGKFTAIFLKRL